MMTGNDQRMLTVQARLSIVTLTSRSSSGTPDSAASFRILLFTARADPSSAIDRSCITSSTTPET